MTNEEKYRTAEERYNAIRSFCHSKGSCTACPFGRLTAGRQCAFAWLTLEAEEEEPLPCPYCKGATIIAEDYFNKPQRQVMCPLCGYRSPRHIDVSEAVRDHNKLVLQLDEGE